MNYFSYYQELMAKIMPVKEGTSMTHYHKALDINKSATKTAFDSFAGRSMSEQDFEDLLTLCRNAKNTTPYATWTQPKFTEEGLFSVSRQGHITRIN
jgi:hypothetical protein